MVLVSVPMLPRRGPHVYAVAVLPWPVHREIATGWDSGRREGVEKTEDGGRRGTVHRRCASLRCRLGPVFPREQTRVTDPPPGVGKKGHDTLMRGSAVTGSVAISRETGSRTRIQPVYNPSSTGASLLSRSVRRRSLLPLFLSPSPPLTSLSLSLSLAGARDPPLQPLICPSFSLPPQALSV